MGKNIFGVSNSADHIDGSDYIVRSNSDAALKKLEQAEAEARSLVTVYVPSKRLALLRTFFLSLAMMCLVVAVFRAKELEKLTFSGFFQTSPYWLAGALLLFVLSFSMVFVERKRMQKARTDQGIEEWKMRSREAEQEAYNALQIPSNAICMDLLTVTYTLKNGSLKSKTYSAFDFRAWVENNCLCLADVENVVAIPLADIQSVSQLPNRVSFYFWNKQEAPDSEAYRQYHIRKTYFGAYSISGIRLVHIRSEHGEYELLVPPYELDTFLRLTGKGIRKEELHAE